MAHLTRELVGGQLAVTPDAETVSDPKVKEFIDKYYSVGGWTSEDRTKLLYFARDLLNSSYAGHKVTFELFAQSPPFAQNLAAYNSFDFEPARNMVRKAANLSQEVVKG
jgi:4-hydroxyphenylacetate 3-monooxygenase